MCVGCVCVWGGGGGGGGGKWWGGEWEVGCHKPVFLVQLFFVISYLYLGPSIPEIIC